MKCALYSPDLWNTEGSGFGLELVYRFPQDVNVKCILHCVEEDTSKDSK